MGYRIKKAATALEQAMRRVGISRECRIHGRPKPCRVCAFTFAKAEQQRAWQRRAEQQQAHKRWLKEQDQIESDLNGKEETEPGTG